MAIFSFRNLSNTLNSLLTKSGPVIKLSFKKVWLLRAAQSYTTLTFSGLQGLEQDDVGFTTLDATQFVHLAQLQHNH